MCLKLCGISGDCRSRPVNMGDEPVNEAPVTSFLEVGFYKQMRLAGV